jgi:hypothetical protein
MPARTSRRGVEGETPRMVLKGSLQTKSVPSARQSRLPAYGGGAVLHFVGSSKLPFSFQETFADLVVYPGKEANLKYRFGPTKSRQTLEVAEGEFKSPM